MSPFLLGVSPASRNRVLGGTYICAHGDASGFFVPRCLVLNSDPVSLLIRHSAITAGPQPGYSCPNKGTTSSGSSISLQGLVATSCAVRFPETTPRGRHALVRLS